MKIITNFVILFAAILTYTTNAEVVSQKPETIKSTTPQVTMTQDSSALNKTGKKTPDKEIKVPNKPKSIQKNSNKGEKNISKKDPSKSVVNKKDVATMDGNIPTQFSKQTNKTKDFSKLSEFALPTIPVESGTLLDRSTRSDGKVSFEIPQAKEMEVPTKGFEG